MKTVVIVDAACDLPIAYFREHDVHLLPNVLVYGAESFTDERSANSILAFHRRLAAMRNPDIKIKPCSVSALTELFLTRLVVKYDCALLITMAQTRSPLFQNATEASFVILRGYREYRKRAGLNAPFYLNVLDSRTMLAGQAVLADAAVQLLRDTKLPFNELRRLIEEFRRSVRCYLLFDQPRYAHVQIGVRRDEANRDLGSGRLDALLGVKWVARFAEGGAEPLFKAHGFDRALARLLERAKVEIDQGLRSPLVVLSYAGEPEALAQKSAFIDFKRHVQRWGIEVMVSVMSATGGLAVGPGAVSLAFAAV